MSRKILHILSGDLWGGAEAQVLHLLCALRNQGVDAEALLFNEGPALSRFRAAGIPCHLVDERAGTVSLFRSGLQTIRSCEAGLLLAHGYKEGFLSAYAARRLKLPWVAVFHGLTERYRGLQALKMAAYKFCYRLSAHRSAAQILTVSKRLARDLGLAESAKTRIIYNTSPAPQPAENTLPRPIIAAIGRLSRVKRFDIAIEAFEIFNRKNPEATLYIIGDGPERQALEKLAHSKSQTRIEFLGFREDAAALVAGADALFITSDSEGVPTVLLEAASNAIPVAAAEVGGIPEVFERLPGYPKILFPAGDIAAAAEALSELLRTIPSHEKRTQVIDLYRQHFAPERAAAEHIRLYQELGISL